MCARQRPLAQLRLDYPAPCRAWALQISFPDSYLDAVGEVFKYLAQSIEQEEVETRLKGPVRHTGFYRLA